MQVDWYYFANLARILKVLVIKVFGFSLHISSKAIISIPINIGPWSYFCYYFNLDSCLTIYYGWPISKHSILMPSYFNVERHYKRLGVIPLTQFRIITLAFFNPLWAFANCSAKWSKSEVFPQPLGPYI